MEDNTLKLTNYQTGEDLTHAITGIELKDNLVIIRYDDGSEPLTKRQQAKLERERIKAIKAQIKADIEDLKQQLKDLGK